MGLQYYVNTVLLPQILTKQCWGFTLSNWQNVGDKLSPLLVLIINTRGIFLKGGKGPRPPCLEAEL